MYRPSGVPFLGDVPAHWTVQPATTVASVATSTVDKKTYEGQRLVRLCNYTDVYYGDRITDASGFMEATATDSEVQRFTLRRGDVAITKDSETSDDIGISAFVEQDMPGVVFGYHLAVYRPKDYWTGRFIKYLFDSSYVKATLETRTLGVTRVGLSQNTLNYMRWPIPSPREREMIARYLDRETAEIDAFIADQERLIELLIERRTSAWQASVESLALTRGVVELRRVIASIVDGPFGSALTSAHYTDAGTRVVRLGNIGVNEFLNSDEAYIDDDYASELTSHAVSPGDVVVAGLGDKGHPLGRSAVVPEGMGAAIVKADCYRVRPTSAVTAAYLAWALSSEYCAQQFRVLSRGSTRQRLNTAVVRDVRLPVPALCDQEQVVAEHEERVSDLLAAIADAREAIALSKERRAALISAAVTGKIDVTS